MDDPALDPIGFDRAAECDRHTNGQTDTFAIAKTRHLYIA